MADKSAKDMFVEAVVLLLEETFDHVHGIYMDKGYSLLETLATISAEEASHPVSSRCASLAAQVVHVTFYLDMTLEFAQGNNPEPIDWGEIWRTVREVTPEEWSASQQQLRVTYQRVIELVKNINTLEEDGVMLGAMSMVVHSAYHLGEIRQALCTLKE
jgi:hypothetical protein